MADSKQYEIVFMMKAALDSSMNQLSTTGGKLKELEEQVQRYQNTVRDIEAFRQQQDGLQKLEQEYQRISQQIQTVNKKFDDATAAVRAADQTYRQHGANIDAINRKINRKINEERTKIAEINAALKQQGADTKTLSLQKAQHQAQIAKLNESLTKEKQALRDSKTALDQAKDAEKAVLEQKNALQKSSDTLREKIGQERAAIQSAADALRKMGVDTSDLDAALAKLGQDARTAKTELEKMAAFRNTLNGWADQFMAIKMAADAILPALQKVNEFFRESLHAAADLQYAMSSVEAVSGASAAQMEQLYAVAKQMGATTRYTALDAANALQQMALAGWEAESMTAALPGVVNLAAAANENLADMTRIVVDGMNAFGMSGTADAKKFADVLAKAATSSSTSVAQLGNALEAVQGTAGNLGYAIEDVGTVLAAMANNGIKASVAGTALNTLLTRLSGGVQTAETLMKDLGVSMYYASDGMGHAAGQAKPLLEFIDELRDGFKQFGDNARDAQVAAYTLAGMRGMKGLLSITNMSDEAWQKLCQDVYQYAGAAETIANISMNNYTGQVYLLSSAWDALKTSVGEQFLPSATEALKVLTDITTATDEFVKNHGGVVRFIAATTVTATGLLTVLGSIAVAIQAVRFAMNTLAVGKLMAAVGGLEGIAAIAIAAGAAFAVLTSEEENALSAGKKLLKSQKDLNQEYQSSVAGIDEEAKSTAYLVAQLQELSAKEEKSAADKKLILNLCQQLNEAVPELALFYDETSDSLQGLTSHLDDYVRGLYEAKRQEENISRMTSLYGSIRDTETAIEEAEKTLESYQRELDGLVNSGADFMSIDNKILEYQILISKLTKQLEEQKAEYDALKNSINNSSQAQDTAADSAETLYHVYDSVSTSLTNLAGDWQKAYDEIYETVSGLFGLFDEVERQEMSLKDMNAAVKSQADFFEDYNRELQTLQKTAEQAGINLSGVWDTLAAPSTENLGAIEAMNRAMKQGDTSKVREYIGEIQRMQDNMAALSGYITTESETIRAAVEQTSATIKKAIQSSEAKQEAITAMSETMDGFRSGVGNIRSELLPMLDTLAGQIRAKIAAIPTVSTAVVAQAKQNPNGYVSVASLRRGYASGTDSAPPGWAWVGEHGPELLHMSGGEQVLPARESAQIAFASANPPQYTAKETTNITLNVTYHVDAAADRDRLQPAFQQNDRRLKSLILNTLAEYRNNQRRRALI